MRRTFLTAVLLSAPAATAAQTPGQVLDSVFAPWKTTTGPGCTVGVDQNGTRTTRAYGMANLEYGVPLKPESVMESGSVAKQFTAAAVVLLAQQGKLSLDDDIRKVLPEVPDFGATITIRNLLNHTSGLRDQWGLLGLQGHGPGQEVHTFARILDIVAHQKQLNFTPGTEYLYSNTGYALAAIIVQRVSGKPFWQYSKEALFDPMKMTKTEWRADYRKVVPDRSTAYAKAGPVWIQDMPFTMVHGNGGLLTTMDDMLTWNEALTKGTIPGGKDLVKALETPSRLNDGTEIAYALGLTAGTFRGIRTINHGGSTAGYRTFLARYPDKGLSVAVFCNAATADAGGYANQIATRLLGLPAREAPPAPVVAIGADELTSIAGVYRDSTNDQSVTFAVKDGGLTASIGGPPVPLSYLGDGRFWNPNSGEFSIKKNGDHWEVSQRREGSRRFLPAAKFDADSIDPGEYVGQYRSAELDVIIDLERDGSNLVINARSDGRFPLRAIYRDGFAGPGRTIRFMRDQSGKVTGLRIFAGRVRDVRFDRI